MLLREVVEVLDDLDAAGVRHWVLGGWGVDLLVGRETRAHRDLDLLVDERDYDRCQAALAALGYEVETEDLPVRIELRPAGDRWVDVHPVRFDGHGLGVQGDPAGVHFDYLPDAFTTGRIGDRVVGCLSAARQLEGHTGYEPRPQDLHDLALLAGLSS